jgi:N-acyl-D-amino-acid deacylase
LAVAARYDGVYQSHIRSESDAVEAALDEVFRIGREAKIPTHVTHFKVTYKQNWGRMPAILAKLEAARKSGLDVTADLYPYVRAGGSFTPLLPPWAQEGGRAEIVRRLEDPSARERIKQELATPTATWENEYYGAGGGPDGFSITDARGNPALKKYEGKTLAAIARAERKDPRDVVLDVILAGDAAMTVLITSEDHLRLAIRHPWVAFGTDGETVAPDGPLSEGLVHPRGYGTYPKTWANTSGSWASSGWRKRSARPRRSRPNVSASATAACCAKATTPTLWCSTRARSSTRPRTRNRTSSLKGSPTSW